MAPTGKSQDEERPSLKDPELYDALTGDGMSASKAARISNAAARDGRSSVGRRGGHAEDYESRTVGELRERAKELGLTGYSRLRKGELIERLREH
ncbi:MAG: Rho termination factor N-terminal domain-containing protein [Microcella sp.]|uniref:Rho termination factor N-terminal domain-containing protein n=1 Tax=Microcella sp. TaxID=1913979 RepID=UPI002727E9A5|nr:Rho termination factor N-terminal domain-containing protein [Microcella sp.]MDO8336807.1 Rho termination factor N-terminal domain-containing protein [Microcella sp.]